MTSRIARALMVGGVAAALLQGVAACGDGTGVPFGAPGITIIDGETGRDTVTASKLLRVVVRGSDGLPASGVVVHFGTGPYDFWNQTPYVSLGESYLSDTAAVDTTDAAGRAEVVVRLGRVAGSAVVEVEAPALNATAVARYTIEPGAPFALRALPADTAVYVGRTYVLRSAMVDRFGNPHDDLRATHTENSAAVAISGLGTAGGLAFGRGLIEAHFDSLVDTAYVSVIPVHGTVAAHVRRRYVGDSIGVAIVDLDGVGYDRFTVETQPRDYGGGEPPGHEMQARWDPAGNRVVYHESMAAESGNYPGADVRRLFVSDISGEPNRLLPSSPFYTELQPDWSRDGKWIYFAARLPEEYIHRIWRVHPDGTELEPVPGMPTDTVAMRPAVSPDGVWLAYVGGIPSKVRVRRIGSQETTDLAVTGTSPRWSPDGLLIAYVVSYDYSGYSGELRVVHPDGTGDRAVVAGQSYAPVVDWSPDGKYLVAEGGNFAGLELIEVATGRHVPLPFARRLGRPAWRPGSTP